jgi:CRP-like cAMP-binding protein
MLAQHNPKQSQLLAALPPADYERLLPDLELVPLPLGSAVYESGKEQEYVYFPSASIVSLLYVMEDGSSAEIAVVGNEGRRGHRLFMGGETTPSRAVVQSAGHAYRLKASLLKKEFERGGPLQYLLLRYTQALITQMAQTAVCNRHHSVEQQLCRWLLLSLDRLLRTNWNMTQELIANMLGRAPRGRDRGCRQAAGGGIDRIQPRQDHRAGSSETGRAGLRVLRGGQAGIRSPVVPQVGDDGRVS